MCLLTVPSAGSEAEVEGGEEGEGDMSALRHKLSDYRDIIGRQEELLQVTARSHKTLCGHTYHDPIEMYNYTRGD